MAILILLLTSTVPTGELCEMQIGKKMVKVQKIVMTKAEVEAMAKKGLVEMKVYTNKCNNKSLNNILI